MTSAAESITESLRRSRQMMVQVSTPVCLIDLLYANDFLLLILKIIFIHVDRKWKEVQIPWQLLVRFLVFLIEHVQEAWLYYLSFSRKINLMF